MNKIYFATGNKGKAAEVAEILGLNVETVHLDLDEIQELNLEKIVRHKVEQAYEKLKSPVLVDDVSVEVDVWKGFPGPFIKYIQEAGGNELLLYMMRNEENRNITVIATIGYHDGENIYVFSGKIRATLITEERGNKGWGLDPILQPAGYDQTYSEMDIDLKNRISHRRLALNKFKEFLDSQNK